jgi:hypothetical protein
MPSEQSLAPMSDSTLTADSGYQGLLSRISEVYTTGQLRAHQAVNAHLTQTYWYPKGQKPSDLLSWSHYVELLRIDDPLERSFYEKQSILEKWSIPELKRQKKSSLFLRLASGKGKDAILQLASQGQIIAQPGDLLRDPFVFEFLKIPEPYAIDETDS